jgi:AcrR family transcriptional regulator
MVMAETRLGPEEWVRAGLKALAKSGALALKADTLANTLGVSRGSFYWHFADVAAFHGAVLKRWREIALENIITEIEATSDPLEALLYRAFTSGSGIESAVRAWATSNPQARKAVETVDAERVRYLRNLMIDAGVDSDIAETRARLMNWAYLGFAISLAKLDDAALKRLIKEVSQLAYAGGSRR